VIVTDHHSLGETLPPANAVINPQRIPKDHPLHSLPGVGVAYKLMEALFQSLGQPFAEGHYRELAALGIVSDVAKLQGDTRYLLQKGLESLRETQRLGLQTLYRIANLNPQNLDETHIGFQIAPRLNAVGRLGDANMVVELLTTNDSGRARVLALQIEAMNAKRRFTTRQVAAAVETLLQMSPEDRHAPAIVLHHPEWPGGVVGIVASRLVEQYHKPVILLTGEDPIHGSARSVEGINITQAITTQSELLNTYGGHPMAAGMSMPAENFKAFKRGFLAAIEKLGEGIAAIPELVINKVISPEEISLDLVEQINRLAPFGPDNPPLNFMIPKLTLTSTAEVGVYGEHRQVIAEDKNQNQARFIWWNGGDYSPPDAEFDVVCQLSRSDYKGAPQVRAEWVDFRITEKGKEEIQSRQFEIIDRRNYLNPINEVLNFLAENPKSQVWGEGQTPKDLPCKGRHKLEATKNLVIWTVPPSQSVLDEVILRTKPKSVVVIGVLPAVINPKTFFERLGGLAKYAVKHKDGRTTLEELASACAATNDSVRIGLMLWEALGKMKVDFEENHLVISTTNGETNAAAKDIYSSLLKASLEESRAFRSYFRKGELNNYLPHAKSI
jgi:single-stranded-DNA-specific exonuclease